MLETTTIEGLAGAAIDIAYVGLLSSALAFTILTVALQHTPPSEAAVIVSMETVFAAAAAYWLLGERLPAIGWAGAALILAATLVLQIGTALGPRAPRPSASRGER
jgi:drug/metabolite transporter (DMT)-like permease